MRRGGLVSGSRARSMHYATRELRGNGERAWWEERALTASYGLRPLYYDSHDEVPEIVNSIISVAGNESGPPPDAGLENIADWLDEVGDFSPSSNLPGLLQTGALPLMPSRRPVSSEG